MPRHAEKSMFSLICHGDSLTEAVDMEPAYRWPALVRLRLGWSVRNTGIGGDTTGGLLARFGHDVLRHRPDAVIVMGGTNDLWWGLGNPLVLSHLFAMCCQAQHHGIAPLLATPLPICCAPLEQSDMLPPPGGYNMLLASLASLAEEMRTAARHSDIPCIDFFRAFHGEDGQVRSEAFLEDGLHPNAEGHRRMADGVVQMAADLFGVGRPRR
jgi:lysophospholipase L1-like esterase